jgi:hypothetical protein
MWRQNSASAPVVQWTFQRALAVRHGILARLPCNEILANLGGYLSLLVTVD